jgi:hypothetical protein
MVLNPRVELWTQISDAEHRGIKPRPLVRRQCAAKAPAVAQSEREGGLKAKIS